MQFVFILLLMPLYVKYLHNAVLISNKIIREIADDEEPVVAHLIAGIQSAKISLSAVGK